MRAYNLYSKLNKDKFGLIYMGEFDDEMTSLLMEIQETSSDQGRGIKKRVSYLIAECFQNIIRHSDQDEIDLGLKSKMFMMRQLGSTHYLVSTNPVEDQNIDTLKETLDSLKNLSAEELKNIYLKALTGNKLSEKGGGGLGLIEMARKTKNPPDYQFEPVGNGFTNFFMQLMMRGKGEEESNEKLPIDNTVALYEEMVKEHVVLLRKGDFSQDAILPLFKLFESNLQLKKEDLVFKKKSLYILIELLQNMNRHAEVINDSREGIFLIIHENGVYTMEAGNFVNKTKAEKFKKHLDSLSGLDRNQLSKRYKEQLMDNAIQEDEGAGIGIIEMFRQSDGEILYSFSEVDEDLSFFTLSATL